MKHILMDWGMIVSLEWDSFSCRFHCMILSIMETLIEMGSTSRGRIVTFPVPFQRQRELGRAGQYWTLWDVAYGWWKPVSRLIKFHYNDVKLLTLTSGYTYHYCNVWYWFCLFAVMSWNCFPSFPHFQNHYHLRSNTAHDLLITTLLCDLDEYWNFLELTSKPITCLSFCLLYLLCPQLEGGVFSYMPQVQYVYKVDTVGW